MSEPHIKLYTANRGMPKEEICLQIIKIFFMACGVLFIILLSP